MKQHPDVYANRVERRRQADEFSLEPEPAEPEPPDVAGACEHGVAIDVPCSRCAAAALELIEQAQNRG